MRESSSEMLWIVPYHIKNKFYLGVPELSLCFNVDFILLPWQPLQLLQTERLSLFAASLRVCFLLFESVRTHLKFQLEMFVQKLIDIIVSEAPRIPYEQKEMALDSLVQVSDGSHAHLKYHMGGGAFTCWRLVSSILVLGPVS